MLAHQAIMAWMYLLVEPNVLVATMTAQFQKYFQHKLEHGKQKKIQIIDKNKQHRNIKLNQRDFAWMRQ
jgi:hypothetical protein